MHVHLKIYYGKTHKIYAVQGHLSENYLMQKIYLMEIFAIYGRICTQLECSSFASKNYVRQNSSILTIFHQIHYNYSYFTLTIYWLFLQLAMFF